MMAKMFYRFEEAKQVLGMGDEQLKQLTREGKLREFRDGAQIMYKADQVDSLKNEMGLGGEDVDLGPSDTGGPIGLVDTGSSTSSGSVISLADTTSKDDTATDLSLSNSGSGSGTGIALAPSGTTGGSLAGGSLGGGSLHGTGAGHGSASGISVLGLDEGGTADPSAATAMGGSFGGEPSLEAMGSGSGLLDLSRERDDTSLGAPVLDEITAGNTRSGVVITGGALSGAATASAAARSGSMPVYVEASDNFTGFAAGASLAAVLFLLVALYAVAAAAMRAQPSLLGFMYSGDGPNKSAMPMLYILGAGIVAALLFGAVGFFVGKRR